MKYQAEEIDLINGLYPIQVAAVSEEEFEGKFGKYLILSFRIPAKMIEGENELDVEFTRPMSAKILPSTNLGRVVTAVNAGEYPTGKAVDTSDLEGLWFEGMIEQKFDEQYVQTTIHTYNPLSDKLRKKLGKEIEVKEAPFNF